MFIKKDLRKIDEILADDSDKKDILKLAKRSAEFQGSVRVLCRESKLESLANLRTLNLYDNCLTNVDGIGLLSQTPIEEINLGCNKLTTLPLEVCSSFYACVADSFVVWFPENFEIALVG